MVDVRRSYRRWFAYRLAILVPAFLSAVAVVLWMAVGSMAPPWLRVTTTTLALLVDMLLGYLLFQTVTCAFFHSRERRREARLLRGLLGGSRTAAFASVGLLWALALVPELFHEPPPPRPFREGRVAPVSVRATAFRSVPDGPDPELRVQTGPSDAGRPLPSAGGGVQDLPKRLELKEHPRAVPAASAPVSSGDDGQEVQADDEKTPRFRPAQGEGMKLGLDAATALGIDRPWLPDEQKPQEILPVEVRLDVLSFSEEETEAAGISLSFDLPLGRTESIRTTYLLAFVEDDVDGFGGRQTFRDEHVTLEYVKRLVGFTRHAPFDLAVSVGLSLDRFSDWSADAPTVEETARLSPHVGIELGFWQSGIVGFSLQAGQTIPINVTGGSASVTDLALVVHVALSEHVSIRAGYQLMLVHLQDYEGPIGSARTSDDLDRKMSGPLLGLEIRF